MTVDQIMDVFFRILVSATGAVAFAGFVVVKIAWWDHRDKE